LLHQFGFRQRQKRATGKRVVVHADEKLTAFVEFGVADCIWPCVTEPTEWQHIGNQIDAAFIFARADFVKV
jgi:hypothetical protein